MEQLKKLFGDGALTYDELKAALQDCKELELADVLQGQYIDKAQYDELAAQLKQTQDERAADAKAFDALYEAQKKDAGIALALTRARAKNLVAAKALLNLEDISLKGDGLTGLEEQLKAVMLENPFLFDGAAQNPPPPAAGSAGPVGDDTAKWRVEAGLPPSEQ